MTTLTYKLEFSKETLERIRRIPLAAEKEFRRRAENQITPQVAGFAQRVVGNYPPPRNSGSGRFGWATEKQRRAFFATNGFGKGIPYRRSGALQKGWSALFDPRINELRVFNRSRYAKYVYGTKQQRPTPGHVTTGWGRGIDKDLRATFEFAEGLVLEVWGETVRSVARKK